MLVVVPLVDVAMLVLVPVLPLSRLEEVLNGSPRVAPGPAAVRSLNNKVKKELELTLRPPPCLVFMSAA